MKIFVFGVGRFFQNRKEQFLKNSDGDIFIGFLDNQASEVKKYGGMTVYHPMVVKEMDFDRIIIMNSYYSENIQQLKELGVSKDKIVFWEQYRAEKTRGDIQVQIATSFLERRKTVLIISTDLEYNGGSIAIVNAAIVLVNRGYNVYLATANCNKRICEELKMYKINLLICPSLPYLADLEINYIKIFDIIIVNVFQMVKAACDISQYKPVLWWIHEPDWGNDSVYGYIRYQFAKYDNIQAMEKIRIYAVSDVAKKAFETYYPHKVADVLPFGIVDKNDCNLLQNKQSGKFVFAIIGAVSRLKGQLDFLKAANMFSENVKNECEWWIIGSCGEDGYGNEVRDFAQYVPNVKFLGIMQRQELNECFKMIDCVVCASQIETMSLTITEGMMYGKICITTDKTGIAGYMKNGVNGFIYRAGDVVALHDCMKKAFAMRDDSLTMRNNARKLYENEFSMERFGERLERALCETEKQHYESTRK